MAGRDAVVGDSPFVRTLEFWFDFASTYSYPAAMRIEDAAARAGVALHWRPFLLGPIFNEQLGIRDSPFNLNPVRGRYMWRDLERICTRQKLPWRKPAVFPRRSVLAAKVANAFDGERWVPAFCRAVFTANFSRDLDIDSPAVLSELLAAVGQDPAATLARAEAQGGLLRARTEEARQLGLFGAPTFVIEGELFFGQDRLADALAWPI